MATVRIPTPLRQYTAGSKAVPVDGKTLAEALEHLAGQWPGLRARLLDGSGQMHPFVNVFVDGEDVRLGLGLATPLREDAEIDVIPAMAGGAEPRVGSRRCATSAPRRRCGRRPPPRPC